MSLQMGNGIKLHSQIPSLVALPLGMSSVSANELPWGSVIFPVVPKPHGSPAVTPGCSSKGQLVTSSSVLLQSALGNTVG